MLRTIFATEDVIFEKSGGPENFYFLFFSVLYFSGETVIVASEALILLTEFSVVYRLSRFSDYIIILVKNK